MGLGGQSALGQKQTFGLRNAMSALSPKADIGTQSRNVRFVPKADIRSAANNWQSRQMLTDFCQ